MAFQLSLIITILVGFYLSIFFGGLLYMRLGEIVAF